MNMRYVVLILSAIALMGCGGGDSAAPAAAASTSGSGSVSVNNPMAAQVKAAKAYERGHTGEGQIISVYAYLDPANSLGFGAFGYDSTYASLAGVFVEGHDGETGSANNVGACKDDACRDYFLTKSYNSDYNGIAGRKNGTAIHGIAYDAKIKIINYGSVNYHNVDYPFYSDYTGGESDPAYITDLAAYNAAQNAYNTKRINSIKASGGAGIAAVINTSAVSTTTEDNGTYVQVSADKWTDPNVSGSEYDKSDATEFYTTPYIADSYGIAYNDEWLEVAKTTIIVSNAGYKGANSVNGLVDVWDNSTDRDNEDGNANSYMEKKATDVYGSAAAANIASYADAITSDHFAGKWIVVTGVDKNNVILSENNGCGGAKQYCLSVPELETGEIVAFQGIDIPLTISPEYTLGGALAVIRSAYPTLTVEQTVALTLGTADYIANSTGEVDDATGKYNAVYGHGLLNLDKATTLSAADAGNANVIARTTFGANWGETQLTLSSHFGNKLDSVNLGVQDKYGRHFVLEAQNIAHENVAIGLDDYMAGLLGDDVQSEKLGAQAQANYSNNADGQNWMNLEYISGKATTKLAFQDSYKISPLNDMGETFQLRANHIRPASNNIGMMDVDYALTRNLTLSSYAARGEYDTGYKFDELGTDIDLRHKKSTLNLGLGHLREHEQFLGTNTTGAYELSAPAISQFTDVTYGHDVGEKFNLYANYIQYKTDVDMGYSEFATIDNLQADQYQVGFKGKNILSDDDGLNVALITKLGVTDGALTQNTVMGYTEAGGYNNVTQSYDLAVSERHQQFEITYQGRLYQNADKVSALQDNRFFTTIRVDQNLNHEAGLGQTEIVTGMQARF